MLPLILAGVGAALGLAALAGGVADRRKSEEDEQAKIDDALEHTSAASEGTPPLATLTIVPNARGVFTPPLPTMELAVVEIRGTFKQRLGLFSWDEIDAFSGSSIVRFEETRARPVWKNRINHVYRYVVVGRGQTEAIRVDCPNPSRGSLTAIVRKPTAKELHELSAPRRSRLAREREAEHEQSRRRARDTRDQERQRAQEARARAEQRKEEERLAKERNAKEEAQRRQSEEEMLKKVAAAEVTERAARAKAEQKRERERANRLAELALRFEHTDHLEQKDHLERYARAKRDELIRSRKRIEEEYIALRREFPDLAQTHPNLHARATFLKRALARADELEVEQRPAEPAVPQTNSTRRRPDTNEHRERTLNWLGVQIDDLFAIIQKETAARDALEQRLDEQNVESAEREPYRQMLKRIFEDKPAGGTDADPFHA